jgi:2-polyprenyl-6-methoxyphenol hydroxylase-like FAD-dependent oxidoreductase
MRSSTRAESALPTWAASIFGALEGRVEAIFGDAIQRLEQRANGVHVEFESGTARDFDLIVGADGLHSRVRELVFGPQECFEHYLGIRAAAFDLERYAPRDELVYVMYSEVGRQAARFSLRDGRTMVLLTFLDPDGTPVPDPNDQRALLRDRFASCGWEVPQIIEALDGTADLYFDRVSQIRIGPPNGWSQGRVALVGDAASCVSLLVGEGCGLAMTAATSWPASFIAPVATTRQRSGAIENALVLSFA